MYLSYEGGKLTSTLINLDIEELCYCLSCIVLKHIENGDFAQIKTQNNAASFSKEASADKTANLIEEPTLI